MTSDSSHSFCNLCRYFIPYVTLFFTSDFYFIYFRKQASWDCEYWVLPYWKFGKSKGSKILVALLTSVAKRVTEFFQRKLHLIPQLLLCWYYGRDEITLFYSGFHFREQKKIQVAWGQVNNVGGWSPLRNFPESVSLTLQNEFIHEIAWNKLRAFLSYVLFKNLTNRLPLNPYPTAFPYGNGMVLHFYQQQESSTTKTVHKVINKGLKAYV